MDKAPTCAQCGTILVGGQSSRRCPRCLFQLALAVDGLPFEESNLEGANASLSLIGIPPSGVKFHYFGDYELISEIARGGMGVVFKARQISLNRLVAVKVLSQGMLATPELVQRFQTEAKAAASLSHPNIVPIFEIGEHTGLHYFSMRLVNGTSLREAITARGPESGCRSESDSGTPRSPTGSGAAAVFAPDYKGCARLVATLARAVHFAHSRGILHRDLKPGNILIDEAGEPHLTDFGLAKLHEQDSTLTRTHSILGTPAYLSPEQARGDTQAMTTAMDIYGLGTILYELLTGRPPFGGGTTVETVRQVLEAPPLRPSRLAPGLDRDLEIVCLKCLEKDADRRYPSAEALAADLDRWLGGFPILAHPVSATEKLWRWTRRKPALAALTAATLALLVVLSIGSTVVVIQLRRDSEDRRRSLYASEMNAAFHAWSEGRARRTRDLLDRQRPRPRESDLRSFDWYYLQNLSQPLERFTITNAGSWAGALSPDGRTFATMAGGKIHLWDTQTQVERMSFGTNLGFGYTLTYAPDGRHLATTETDAKRIRIWDSQTGALQRTIDTPLKLLSAAYSPDGTFLVSSSGYPYNRDGLPGDIVLWEAASGRLVRRLDAFKTWAFSACYSPDGRIIAAPCGDGFLRIYEPASGELRGQLGGHRGFVCGLAFTHDGRQLATGDQAGYLRLWNVEDRRLVHVVHAHSAPIYAVAVSHDDRYVAVGCLDHTTMLFDRATMEEVTTLAGHSGRVVFTSFSPSDTTLYTLAGTGDDSLKAWPVPAQPSGSPSRLARSGWLAGLQFFPDGHHLLVSDRLESSDPQVAVWEIAGQSRKASFPGHHAVVTPDGRNIVLVRSNALVFVDTATFREMDVLKCAMAGRIVVSSDGRWLAGQRKKGESSELVLVDLPRNREVRSLGSLPSASVPWAFVRSNKRLICAGRGGTSMDLWDLEEGRLLVSLPITAHVSQPFALSHDGRTLAIAGDAGQVRLFDAETLAEGPGLPCEKGWIRSLAFCADDRTLAVGYFDAFIQLWNMATRSEVATLLAHASYVDSMAFSPDGSILASTSADNTVRFWHAPGLSQGVERP